MQIWAESGKSALPICNYSQILYQFLTFTQNLKRSQVSTDFAQTVVRMCQQILCLFDKNFMDKNSKRLSGFFMEQGRQIFRC